MITEMRQRLVDQRKYFKLKFLYALALADACTFKLRSWNWIPCLICYRYSSQSSYWWWIFCFLFSLIRSWISRYDIINIHSARNNPKRKHNLFMIMFLHNDTLGWYHRYTICQCVMPALIVGARMLGQWQSPPKVHSLFVYIFLNNPNTSL